MSGLYDLMIAGMSEQRDKLTAAIAALSALNDTGAPKVPAAPEPPEDTPPRGKKKRQKKEKKAVKTYTAADLTHSCGFVAPSRRSYGQHKRSCNGKPKVEAQRETWTPGKPLTPAGGAGKFVCYECQHKFQTIEERAVHLKKEHPDAAAA